MGAAVGRVLPVDEREILLAEAVGMRKGQFQRLVAEMQGRVLLLVVALVVDEVQQPALRGEDLAVVVDGECGIQVGVEAQPAADVLLVERVALEDLRVRRELHECPVQLLRAAALLLLHQLPVIEARLDVLSPPVTTHDELRGQGVDRLGADAVEADAELEYVVVVLGSGVDPRYALDDLAERNPASVIPDRYYIVLDCDVELLSVPHDELIDPVVDDFLQQHVDAVLVLFAASRAADVHPRPQPYVLERRERLDFALVILRLLALRHVCYYRKMLCWKAVCPARCTICSIALRAFQERYWHGRRKRRG